MATYKPITRASIDSYAQYRKDVTMKQPMVGRRKQQNERRNIPLEKRPMNNQFANPKKESWKSTLRVLFSIRSSEKEKKVKGLTWTPTVFVITYTVIRKKNIFSGQPE